MNPIENPTTLLKDWEVEPLGKTAEKEKIFSADDVINAYLQGKKAQADQEKMLRLEKFVGNLKSSIDNSLQIFEFIKKNGFKCHQIFLKIQNIYEFTALFLIAEKDYCDRNFDKIYGKTIDIKKKANQSSTFDFTVILTPKTATFNNKALLIDGFNITYGN